MKRRSEPRAPRAMSAAESLWRIDFSYQYEDTQHCGTFQMAVRAANIDDALDRCRRRIRHFRETKRAFDGPIGISFEAVTEVRGSLEEGIFIDSVPPGAGGRYPEPEKHEGHTLHFLGEFDAPDVREFFLVFDADERAPHPAND